MPAPVYMTSQHSRHWVRTMSRSRTTVSRCQSAVVCLCESRTVVAKSMSEPAPSGASSSGTSVSTTKIRSATEIVLCEPVRARERRKPEVVVSVLQLRLRPQAKLSLLRVSLHPTKKLPLLMEQQSNDSYKTVILTPFTRHFYARNRSIKWSVQYFQILILHTGTQLKYSHGSIYWN